MAFSGYGGLRTLFTSHICRTGKIQASYNDNKLILKVSRNKTSGLLELLKERTRSDILLKLVPIFE